MQANEDPVEASFHPRNDPLNQLMGFIGCSIDYLNEHMYGEREGN